MEVPPAWRDLGRGVFARSVIGLVLVWVALGALQSVRGGDTEASWLLDNVSVQEVEVVEAWYEADFHAPSRLRAEVRLGDRVAEVDRLKGSAKVGEKLAVLVNPRNGHVWELSAARDAADPGELPVVLGVTLAGCTLFAGWLVLRPARLRFRMAHSHRLATIRGDVTRVEEDVQPRRWLQRRLHRWPPVWVRVADVRGGYWTLAVPHRVLELDRSLVGRRITVATVGRPFRPGRGALLLVDGPADADDREAVRVWCTSGPYRAAASTSA